jgi:sugar O-acyltransferase (sialic acid O-acetyltransferase NeuD family)
MNKKIAIIGAGGHGKVVGEIALLNDYETIDFFDDRKNYIKEYPFNISGTLDHLKKDLKNYDSFFIAIGQNQIRSDIFEWFKKKKLNIVSLIHPKSTISKLSTIDVGTCVMANATVNPGTIVKEGVIINTSASVDHDCVVEDFAHISPNCSLSGNIRIGKFSHLGTGTSVHPGIHIGNKVKTAVGSKVFKDILDDTVYIS